MPATGRDQPGPGLSRDLDAIQNVVRDVLDVASPPSVVAGRRHNGGRRRGARMQWLIDNLTLIIGTASILVGLVLITLAVRELRRQRE